MLPNEGDGIDADMLILYIAGVGNLERNPQLLKDCPSLGRCGSKTRPGGASFTSPS